MTRPNAAALGGRIVTRKSGLIASARQMRVRRPLVRGGEDMGTWTAAYERLVELRDSGATTEEVEQAAGAELDQLLQE
jgi:hypothetical protein